MIACSTQYVAVYKLLWHTQLSAVNARSAVQCNRTRMATINLADRLHDQVNRCTAIEHTEIIGLRTNTDGSDNHVARSKENIFKLTKVRIEESATQRDAFDTLWGANNIDHGVSIPYPAHSLCCTE